MTQRHRSSAPAPSFGRGPRCAAGPGARRLTRVIGLVAVLLLGTPHVARAVIYQYDPQERLARVTYDNGVSIAYVYDQAGNLVSKTIGRLVDVPPSSGAYPLSLGLPAPNPFARTTTLRYSLPSRMQVRLAVFDVSGRRVALLVNGWQGAGPHVVGWDGTGPSGRPLASGLYFVRLEAGRELRVRKVLLVR